MHGRRSDAVPNARRFRKHATHPERIAWNWLRDRRFGDWKFRRQYPIGPFVVDFYCDALKLAIEVDGSTHLWQWEYDKARSRYLQRVGIEVLRISNDEVLKKPTVALALIKLTIRERLPLTRSRCAGPPSPEGEG